MRTMSAEMHTKMGGMMQQMGTHRTELNNSLTALEQEVQSSAKDTKKVSALAARPGSSRTASFASASEFEPGAFEKLAPLRLESKRWTGVGNKHTTRISLAGKRGKWSVAWRHYFV
ncbi:MAG: hypothetical protein JJE04_11170 [Acidobacteriia bacterium]|nr:hypothetical protein [Terriglobia bacterium]